jgi:hypothetical protein
MNSLIIGVAIIIALYVAVRLGSPPVSPAAAGCHGPVDRRRLMARRRMGESAVDTKEAAS